MLAMQDVLPSNSDALVGEELQQWLIRKRQAMDLDKICFAQGAARFAATDDWEESGSASAIDWLRFNCHMNAGHAANSIAVGKSMQ